jgi:hypothetical protein
VLDDLVLTVSCSAPDDLSQQILFVPLR